MKSLLTKTLALVLACSISSVASAQVRGPKRVVGNNGPARGGSSMPDLIVQEFVRTAAVKKQGSKYVIPFTMKVKNVGGSATGNQFWNKIHVGNNQNAVWHSWTGNLAPGATKVFQGVIKVPTTSYMGGGRKITMIATTDAHLSAGDTSGKQDWVKESNEFNNRKWLVAKTPGALPMAPNPGPQNGAATSGQYVPTPSALPNRLPSRLPNRPQARPASRPTTIPTRPNPFGRR